VGLWRVILDRVPTSINYMSLLLPSGDGFAGARHGERFSEQSIRGCNVDLKYIGFVIFWKYLCR